MEKGAACHARARVRTSQRQSMVNRSPSHAIGAKQCDGKRAQHSRLAHYRCLFRAHLSALLPSDGAASVTVYLIQEVLQISRRRCGLAQRQTLSRYWPAMCWRRWVLRRGRAYRHCSDRRASARVERSERQRKGAGKRRGSSICMSSCRCEAYAQSIRRADKSVIVEHLLPCRSQSR